MVRQLLNKIHGEGKINETDTRTELVRRVDFDRIPRRRCGAHAHRADDEFAIRGTLPWHNFLSGPTAWNEEQYRAYLDRLAALKLNLVSFHCYTGGAERYATYVEPIIRIKYRDVLPEATFDTSLTARWGYRPLAVKDFVFGTGKLFDLPDGAQAFGADAP